MSIMTNMIKIDAIDQIAHDLASPVSFLDQYVNCCSVPKDDCNIDNINIDEVAKRSITKIRKMLEQMRNISKEHLLEIDMHDYAATIKDLIPEMKGRAAEGDISISYEGPEKAEGLFDKNKMERVFANILTNAIESIEGRSGSISISLHLNDKEVCIKVGDNGKGIPKAYRKKIFEKGETFGKENGTGLGLHYSKEIISLHGGTLEVESTEGVETVFSITLPNIITDDCHFHYDLSENNLAVSRMHHFNDCPGDISLDPLEL